MTCQELPIAAYVEGELDPAAERSVERHLEGCPSCRALVADLRAQFADDPGPVQEGCPCVCCRSYSRAYVRHLAVANEMLAGILLSPHNIRFLQDLMHSIRQRAGCG